MSEYLSELRTLLNRYHNFAVKAPNIDLSASELNQAVRIKTAIINTLANLQALRRIDDSIREEILLVVKKSDITQASTAVKLEAVIRKL
ncbi:hypothetical protein J4437_03825 [Candidatus Woesearchaeota archaeon]|nr:hypothetical protein [Candidatus Woesearchaeota archaeon]